MAKNAKHDAHHDDHRPNVKLYLAIGAALFVLTAVTVWISKFHLAKGPAIALGLFVALVKGSLVAAVFMHLWGESKVIVRGLLITVACGAILLIPFIDARLVAKMITRPVSVADQKPAAHEEHGARSETVTETATLPAPAGH